MGIPSETLKVKAEEIKKKLVFGTSPASSIKYQIDFLGSKEIVLRRKRRIHCFYIKSLRN